MKALLLVGVWVALGVAVAMRRPMALGDRALTVVFWPFFLGQPPPEDAPSSVHRLATLLQSAPATAALGRSLLSEDARLQATIIRLRAARAEVAGAGAKSEAVLSDALTESLCQRDRLTELADEAGARLLVARERAEGADAVIADLRAHLAALVELHDV